MQFHINASEVCSGAALHLIIEQVETLKSVIVSASTVTFIPSANVKKWKRNKTSQNGIIFVNIYWIIKRISSRCVAIPRVCGCGVSERREIGWNEVIIHYPVLCLIVMMNAFIVRVFVVIFFSCYFLPFIIELCMSWVECVASTTINSPFQLNTRIKKSFFSLSLSLLSSEVICLCFCAFPMPAKLCSLRRSNHV